MIYSDHSISLPTLRNVSLLIFLRTGSLIDLSQEINVMIYILICIYFSIMIYSDQFVSPPTLRNVSLLIFLRVRV